jgi:hypothetical protein
MQTPNMPPPDRPVLFDTWDNYSTHAGIVNNSNIEWSYGSCGVTILSGINVTEPALIVSKVLTERHKNDRKRIREAFVMFSDKDHSGILGGNALCKYIQETKQGDIVEFGPRMNPNTGNMIKLWIWTPPHESLLPKDRWVPVRGLTLKFGKFGWEYVEDPRFSENLK